MLLDSFNRKIDYLRISVTDRCNHRCLYCVPQIMAPPAGHKQILSYEQIESIAKVAVNIGITKIRLTGGEPLVRKDIACLVAKLAAIDGVEDLCMTTNGVLLSKMAEGLKASGLGRVNISIDSLDPDRYRRLTRGGDLSQVLAGLEAAQKANLGPIKINMVILEDTTEAEIEKMQIFCKRENLKLQRIMQFSLYDRQDLSQRFHTERPPKCISCNRLRLTADGFFKPCLFSEDEMSVDFCDIRGSILKAVQQKPRNGVACTNRLMNQIGG